MDEGDEPRPLRPAEVKPGKEGPPRIRVAGLFSSSPCDDPPRSSHAAYAASSSRRRVSETIRPASSFTTRSASEKYRSSWVIATTVLPCAFRSGSKRAIEVIAEVRVLIGGPLVEEEDIAIFRIALQESQALSLPGGKGELRQFALRHLVPANPAQATPAASGCVHREEDVPPRRAHGGRGRNRRTRP